MSTRLYCRKHAALLCEASMLCPIEHAVLWCFWYERICDSPHSCSLRWAHCTGCNLGMTSYWIGLAGTLLVSMQQVHLNTLTCVHLLDNMSACKLCDKLHLLHNKYSNTISYIHPCSSSSHKKRPAYKFERTTDNSKQARSQSKYFHIHLMPASK